MLDVFLIILGAILLLAGFVFCFIPAISGPLVCFVSLVFLRLVGTHTQPSGSVLLMAAGVTVLAIVIDYVAPMLGARKFHASRWGMAGSLIGTIVGLFFFPWGVLVGPFIGAFLGECIARKPPREALKGAVGAFLGYATGLFVKLACCVLLAVWFVLSI